MHGRGETPKQVSTVPGPVPKERERPYRTGVARVTTMLVTASTIKDSPDNVRFFVAANLASGIDHMFVFLDAPRDEGQAEVADFLRSHPHVTCVRTGRSWWDGDRPGNLNVRQRINANWTRSVLEPLDWVEWLFHVDGDEVVALDRGVLDAVPAGTDAVRLRPLEAVSRADAEERPTAFKRLLEDSELSLLQVLGVLDEPTNQAYFHGHVMGKSGVRPSSGLGLTLHDALTPDGHAVDGHEDPGLSVLHYDAVSAAQFVRKWAALATAGPARYRASRAPVAKAARALVTSDLSPEVREKYLRRIYERTTADDVATLEELGLLVHADPLAGGHRPRPLSDQEVEALQARTDQLRDRPKRQFLVEDQVKDRRHDPAAGRRAGRGWRPQVPGPLRRDR